MNIYKILALEPTNKTADNLLFWIKHYYVYRFSDASIVDNPSDDFDLSLLINNMLSIRTDNMDKVIKIVNKASKNIKGINSSHSTFKPFYEHIQNDVDVNSIKDINQRYVKDYILSVNSEEEQPLKERYYTHLKKLFNFIDECNIDEDKKRHIFNIGKDKEGKAEKLFRTHKGSRIPIYLEPYEFEQLNKSIVQKKHYTDDFEWSKRVLIARLFMLGLLKTSEVINLKDEDFIDVDDKNILELRVDGRIVSLPRAKFIKYLNVYRELKKCDDSQYFFCSIRNQSAINNQHISKIIEEQLNNAGISKRKKTSEVLRNSGMVYLRRGGYSDIKLKDMTGTKTIRTIQDFLKSVNTDHIGISSIMADLVD
jgi:hypothetical protein